MTTRYNELYSEFNKLHKTFKIIKKKKLFSVFRSKIFFQNIPTLDIVTITYMCTNNSIEQRLENECLALHKIITLFLKFQEFNKTNLITSKAKSKVVNYLISNGLNIPDMDELE